MTPDNLLARTSHYQPRRTPLWTRLSRGVRFSYRSLERIQFDADNNNNNNNNNNNESGSSATPRSDDDFRVTTTYDDDGSSSNEDGDNDDDEDEDEDEDEEEDDIESDDGPSVAEIERINRQNNPLAACPEDDDVSSEYGINEQRPMIPVIPPRHHRLRRRDGRRPANNNSSVEGFSASYLRSTMDTILQAVPGGVLEPHAHFFIERGKSMVSIKFDPAPYVSFLFLFGR